MSESWKTRLSRYGQRERRAQTLGQPRRAWLHTRQLDRCRTGISRVHLPKATAADFTHHTSPLQEHAEWWDGGTRCGTSTVITNLYVCGYMHIAAHNSSSRRANRVLLTAGDLRAYRRISTS